MASTTWPDGSPKSVDDNEYELMASAWAGDGIFGTPADTAPVYADGTSGMAVKFRLGKSGLVHGHGWSSGASDITKTITSNSSGQPRIDLAVLGLDRSTWLVTEYVKTGVAAASPVAPALLRDAVGPGTGKWEIPIATISVASGVSAINAGDVTPIATYLGPSQILYVANTTALNAIPSPVGGQIAYLASAVTDGHPFYGYITGTGWRRLDWNNEWGLVGGKTYTGSGDLFYFSGSMADTGLRTGSVSLINGRRYAIDLSGQLGFSATSDAQMYLYLQLAKVAGGTVGDMPIPPFPVYQGWWLQRSWDYVPTADESVNFALSAAASTTAGTVYNSAIRRHAYNAYFRVRDLGPASKLTAA